MILIGFAGYDSARGVLIEAADATSDEANRAHTDRLFMIAFLHPKSLSQSSPNDRTALQPDPINCCHP